MKLSYGQPLEAVLAETSPRQTFHHAQGHVPNPDVEAADQEAKRYVDRCHGECHVLQGRHQKLYCVEAASSKSQAKVGGKDARHL